MTKTMTYAITIAIILMSATLTSSQIMTSANAVLPASFVSTAFPVPGTSTSHGVAVDPNGIVYWADFSSPGAIVKQDPSFAPGDILGFTVFSLSGSGMSGPITNQIDTSGNIWFGTSNNFIGKLVPSTGIFTSFGPIPQSGCFPDQLAFDATGNVWFDCLGSDKLGILNLPAGTFDMFVTPTANSAPSGITVDFTGIVWSIERFGDNVVRLDPALAVPNTSIGVTEFAVPTSPSGPETVKVCGNKVWFTQLSRSGGNAQIAFLDKVTTSITEFTVDAAGIGGTYGVVIDGDGNPWATNPSAPKIYGFDVSTNTATTFTTPTTPHHIALSPSGDLWYVDISGQVVRMTPNVALKPTCAPLEPPEEAEPRTIGFWKNHEDETTEHLSITIGDLDVTDFATAELVFNVNAKNAHDMLAAQLLAAEINVWNGVPSCDEVDDAISDAQSELADADYTGPGTTTAPKKGDKGAVNAIKDVLDDFNNNGCS